MVWSEHAGAVHRPATVVTDTARETRIGRQAWEGGRLLDEGWTTVDGLFYMRNCGSGAAVHDLPHRKGRSHTLLFELKVILLTESG
ncbi:hypothetical protein DPEC_G00004440 [Dallia pectoralis]|uniref:Uncharacterized protein n=1 Tax=Dallia pectoralis TaxID=75939 RepID=A0ACC2HJN2_DALPE|nr:hypothetical protein DPEC_G00004440 [Dallia pectoralis]